MLLHQFALFTPFFYVIFGEILPSRSGKMRLKLKTLTVLCVCVGLIALCGYFYRGISGEEDYDGRLAAQGAFDDSILHVKVPGQVRRKQGPKRERLQNILEEEIVGNLMKQVGKEYKHVVEKKVHRVNPPARKARKDFPEPISLKPQQPKPADAGRQKLPNEAPLKPPVDAPRPQAPQRPAQPPAQHPAQPPGNNKPRPPAINQPAPQPPQLDTRDINQARLDAAKQKQLKDRIKLEQSQHAAQHKQEVNMAGASGKPPGSDSVINLSVVCCGDRTNETLVMLKSATVLTQQLMHFHIFAEDELQAGIAQRLNAWPSVYRRKFAFSLHPISFPPGEDPAKWKKVFKTCATQRLFLPDLLPNVDSLLYVDTDILFIRPVEEIYSFFKQFNSTQMAALAPEHEAKNIGWYNRFARHPYYGETGMNSGVMLMNLTRMRRFGWTQTIVPLYHEYKLKITWGDQDLINILFHDYPQGLFPYACEWNYRPDHCMYSNNCHRTNEHGIAVIHGNRGVYHNMKQPAFRAIYESFRDYTFGADLEKGLIEPLKHHLTAHNIEKNYCAKAVFEPVTSTLRKYADQVIPIKDPV
ncbi:glucoside xylosyltransferase 1-like isoform X3 [Strongylocentrotus purpuratus]|uniref:UDP-D-xylose:beta-D-glucoside alpha-1,3-D-xylosyltransferase n=1 Tax=Strongylocentrotus purpuratus TaxID=7668 RepID=A0A7M7PCI8_STRPU|nr:glucoside xylosyltransferase 1-like isoform X1 [Strongylocentrotus purpuratus]XP_030849202.1 glucoside xylosyltransferase 1-like isoform X2 [Strongylocentrotus purpuratus]XP_030849203.1 glucoside xylosyltransferase 1-like isoform X3 [Strongylocentrotus purpuratus]